MTGGLRGVEDIFNIFGPFYLEVRDIGLGFFLVFLVVALIHELFTGIEGNSSYKSIFVRGLLIGGLFMIYTPVFREITHGMQLLANFFMPSEEFNETIKNVFASYRQRDIGMLSFLKMTIVEWAMNSTYFLAYWVIRMFNWVRLVFLSMLYISGPIFLGIGIYQSNMAKNWIRWILEVSMWNVVLSLFVRVLTQLNFFELYQRQNTPILDLVAMNFVLILMVVFFVPTFSSMMIRGASGISGAGGAVLGFGTAMLLRQTGKSMNGINKFVQGIKNFTQKFFKPSVSRGTMPKVSPKSYKEAH